MQRKYVNYVPIELCWDNENEVKKYLKKQIKECQEKTS
jgi:hypothetical protein